MGTERGGLSLLLVEDNPGDVDLVREYLSEGSGDRWPLRVAGSLAEALDAVGGGSFDAILLDLGLPDADGFEALDEMEEEAPDVPVIVLTGLADEEAAWEAVGRGAEEYLRKDELSGPLLRRTVRYAVERSRSREALRAMEARLRAIVEQALIGIYALDADGRITFVNPRMEEILGYPEEELLGREVAGLAVEEDREEVRGRIEERFGGGAEVADYTVRARRKDGEVVHLEVQGRRVELDGEPAILGTAADITEKRALRDQLLQAQKMEAVGRLAGGVAHDFNNVLTTIGASAGFLLDALAERDPRREDAREIARAAERAAALTRQLLVFSRKDRDRPRVLEIGGVVTGMESMLRRLIGEDVRLALQIDSGIPPVRIDPGLLEQLIVNLAVNARDAMPGGGRLEIAATGDPERAREWDPEIVRKEEGAYLTVLDTGEGIAEEDLPHIFEPFYTTKEQGKGSGLGLSTAYGIVSRAGGEIRAVSTRTTGGGGTRLTVFLPRSDVAEEPAAEEDREPAGGGERILLVEDEDPVRRVVKRMLERNGYRVEAPPDAATAAGLAPEELREVDLLISDVIMPEIHGPELARRLRERAPDLPVLFMSGYSERELTERGGVERIDVLPKPFGVEALLRKVREALEGAPASRDDGSAAAAAETDPEARP